MSTLRLRDDLGRDVILVRPPRRSVELEYRIEVFAGERSQRARVIDGILAASPKQVEQYRAGQDKLFGFFVGQVMKASKGKANPQQVNERLLARLKG